ncbi:UNVERIFIED_CONTAM: UPF0598 protein [Trichonephila clavipes]
MLPESGRIYHPGPEATGGVGLIKSSLAIQLSQKFIYQNKENTDDMPISFVWKGVEHNLILGSLQTISLVNFCICLVVENLF